MLIDFQQLLLATLGTLAFLLYFSINKKHLVSATLVGFISWLIYLILKNFQSNEFICILTTTLIICFYSEFMARKQRAPVNIFLIPGIIPLLPGGSLYYTMYYLIEKNNELFSNYASLTLETTLGIVVGILFGSTIVKYYYTFIKK